MEYRTRQVRYSYPDELIKLAVSLGLSYPVRDVAHLLDIPQSSLYRWLAFHRKYPLVERTDTRDTERQKVYQFAEICASYGFEVREKLQLFLGEKATIQSGAQLLSAHCFPNRRSSMSRINARLNDQQSRCSRTEMTKRNQAAPARLRPETIARLTLVKAEIDSRYFSVISCYELGNAVRMSRFNLIRRFTALFGMSPYRYLQSVRVRNAKSMLISLNRPLDDIATAVGFESASSLVRAFKSVEGISLSVYCRGIRLAA